MSKEGTVRTVKGDLVLAEGLIALGLAVDRLRAGLSRELELTPQQVQLICALGHGNRSTGRLAALLGCDKANITGMVDRLEPRGLVQRSRDTRDRRVVRIALTPDGRAMVDTFRSRAAAAFAEGLSELSPPERTDLNRATRRAVGLLGPELLDDAQ